MVVQNGNEGFRIGVRLGHFLHRFLQGHDFGTFRRQVGFRHFKSVTVQVVEALRHIPGKLQVLGLVGAYRHIICLIQQDIRRHQGRIGKQARIDIVRMFGRFILELGHTGQLPEEGVAGKNPAKLRVVVHMALDKHKAFLRINTAGQQQGESFQTLLAQFGRFLPHC